MTKLTKVDSKIRPVNLTVETDQRLQEVGKSLIRTKSGAKAGMSAVTEAALNFFFEAHAPFIQEGRSIEQVVTMAEVIHKRGLPKNTVLVDYNGEYMSLSEIAKIVGHDRKWVKRRVVNGVFQNEE